MKAYIKIPKGWRRLRAGETVMVGDRRPYATVDISVWVEVGIFWSGRLVPDKLPHGMKSVFIRKRKAAK